MQICHLRLLPTAREGNVFRCVCLPPSGIPPSGGLPLVATTAAVGTHPTGMHSCLLTYLQNLVILTFFIAYILEISIT